GLGLAVPPVYARLRPHFNLCAGWVLALSHALRESPFSRTRCDIRPLRRCQGRKARCAYKRFCGGRSTVRAASVLTRCLWKVSCRSLGVEGDYVLGRPASASRRGGLCPPGRLTRPTRLVSRRLQVTRSE